MFWSPERLAVKDNHHPAMNGGSGQLIEGRKRLLPH